MLPDTAAWASVRECPMSAADLVAHVIRAWTGRREPMQFTSQENPPGFSLPSGAHDD